MSEPLKPWHDAPPCPSCGSGVASPLRWRSSVVAADRLFCPACGHDWTETDVEVIARAWWSLGAYESARAVGAL